MTSPDHAPRIAPLQAPYEPTVAQALAKWMPPGSAAEPLRLFRTLVLHGELAGRMRPLGAGILGASATVAPLLREVMIHRTCGLTGARYEWGVHAAAFGRPLGLSDAQLHSSVHGSSADDCWDERQRAVMRLAEELHATSAISTDLWHTLAASFAETEILELIVTAGWYHLIAFLCNGLQIEPEDWAEQFPASSPAPASAPAS